MPLWYQNNRNAILLLQSVLGMLLFAYSLNRRDRFVPRLLVGTLIGALFCNVLSSYTYIMGNSPLAIFSHAALSIVVYMTLIVIVFFSYKESIWTALFAAASGYIAQDLAGSVKQLVKQIPVIMLAAEDNFGIMGVDMICYGGVYLALFLAFRPYTKDRTESFDDKIKTVFSVVVLLICVGMARITQDDPDRSQMAAIAEPIYAILVNVFILALQFGVMEQAKLSNSVDAMRELMHQQRAQFESRKESVQIINERYHDLKHLFRKFEGRMPRTDLAELEQSIDRYDKHIDSGNEVLDVLLTETLVVCSQRNINLTCSLGHTDFGFVDELDLYTLFHNALNNAINAVSSLPADRERFITLSASREKNALTIHMENPCEGEIDFEDGVPQSDGDPMFHGFGMKSMMRTAEKYSGILAAKQEKRMFYLDILLLAL